MSHSRIHSAYPSIRTWYHLFKLGVSRMQSAQHYQALQSYIAEASIDELEARGVHFADCRVLELGAGLGGYSLVLQRRSNHFLATDFEKDEIFDELGIPSKNVNVAHPFPFEDNAWDLIYCSSLIEHVADPEFLLRESWRVLRPGGWLLLSFPPFYSLFMIGGHSFKPFHFLGERTAIRLTNLVHLTNFRSYVSCYGTWGLHPLTIDGVRKLILGSHFELIDVYTRMSALNTARLPGFLKDLLTWHVCYLARKPETLAV